MDQPVKISLDTQQNDSQNFAFLREEGLKVIQRLGPGTWTDHNLHDPGITMLEALSYAITEAGFLNSISMPDLLTSGEKQAPQEFFTAARVLPSSPVTVRDFQKLLIDHPLINMAWVSALYGDILGRMSILLEFENAALNSNVISSTVNVLSTDYRVDIAFPYWDDPEVVPLQEDVQLQAVNFINPLTPWQLLDGSNAYFTRISVTYQPQGGGPLKFEAWVVIQITAIIVNPLTELPLILQAISNFLQLLGDNSATDLTLLKQYNRRVTEAFETSRIIRRYVKNYRNLCQTFADFSAVRLQEVAISANIEVASNINVETLLADIFFAIDNHISPEIISTSLSALQDLGKDSAVIFEGPLTNFGFIPDELLATNLSTNKLYTSDIIRLILQLRRPDGSDIQTREDMTNRSIVAVRDLSLSLYIDNRKITTDAKDCLQLINSIRHIPRLSPAKCQVSFIRNNIEVKYDIARVIELFNQKKSLAGAPGTANTQDIGLPDGVSYETEQYYPVQNNLPITYGVGAYGLPVTASPERKAQAKQLKGYLFFFEQILAGYFSQIAHVNTFFSASPAINATLYQQPLYNIPGVSDLFVDFNPVTETWEQFQADQNNLYRAVLNKSLETEDQFLDRRHRTLDHLLSRQGEDMNDFTAMAYKESYTIPNASSLTLPQLQALQEQHRLATSRRLLSNKAAYYYDLPYLNENRLQSFGIPDRQDNVLILIQNLPAGFQWLIQDAAGNPLLRNITIEPSETSARLKAAEVLTLATSAGYYGTVVETGGQIRLVIRISSGADPVGMSFQTFNTPAIANNAITVIIQNLLNAWVDNSLSSLEAKLSHLLDIKVKGERRQLLTSFSEYFEVFNDALLQKRFRLRQLAGPAGNILLESENSYPGNAEAAVAIADTIRNGLLAENYVTDLPAPGPFNLTLTGSDGNIIARSPNTFPTTGDANTAADLTRAQLYRYYSVEGFYLIEHILLAPVATGDTSLVIFDAINPCQPLTVQRKDPYSCQLSFIFPSGYSRDFNLTTAVKQESQPDHYRDEEFRAYIERTIRQACPGHILPVILWVDSALPGTAIPANAPCFDNLETRYRQWLAAYFTDEVPESILGPLRNSLADMLNRLYADAT